MFKKVFFFYFAICSVQLNAQTHKKTFFGTIHMPAIYNRYWAYREDPNSSYVKFYDYLALNTYSLKHGEIVKFYGYGVKENLQYFKFYNLKLNDTVYLFHPKTGKTCPAKVVQAKEFFNLFQLNEKIFKSYEPGDDYNELVLAKEPSCEEIDPPFKEKNFKENDYNGAGRFISIGSKQSFAGLQKIPLVEKNKIMSFKEGSVDLQFEKKNACAAANFDYEHTPILGYSNDKNDVQFDGSLLQLKLNNTLVNNNKIFLEKNKYEYPSERCIISPILYRYPEKDKYLLYFESYLTPYSFVKRFKPDKLRKYNQAYVFSVKACLIENGTIDCNELSEPTTAAAEGGIDKIDYSDESELDKD